MKPLRLNPELKGRASNASPSRPPSWLGTGRPPLSLRRWIATTAKILLSFRSVSGTIRRPASLRSDLADRLRVATVFSKNRDRLLEGEIARLFFAGVLEQARSADLLSDEHFSVDGTLMEAWAGQKSFQRKDGSEKPPPDEAGNPTVDFHGEKRSNETHESTTDADARLARKSGGHEAKLAYCGNVLIENRNGLVVDAELLQANGTAERDAALLMAERMEGSQRVTVAADKGYDTQELVREMRGMNVTPHVAQNDHRRGGSAMDGRTTRQPGYKVSQVKRKRIEEVFGWLKTVGMLPKTRPGGVHTVGWVFTFAAAAYHLVRMRNLLYMPVQSV